MTEPGATGSTIEFRLRSPGGGCRWVETRYTPVRDAAGRLKEIEGIIIDVTERKESEKVAQLARTDPLTGLANRTAFLERLHQAHASAQRGANPFAVLYLDLDHFKEVNDTQGHPVGDLLLKDVAARLLGRVRETDLVARLGGDEFAILQTEISDPADAGALGSAVVSALAAPYYINGAELRVTVSVGITPSTAACANPDALLAQADLALYRAKEDGRNQFRFHTADLDRRFSERASVANDLREAIQRHELYLEYQPQVELLSGRIIGVEALVRWRHPTRGALKPDAFLPIAGSTGVINEIGQWVRDQACRQMEIWRGEGVAPPIIAVNVSLQELKSGEVFVRDLAETLNRHDMKGADLELDVTEATLAKLTLAQNNVLDQLAELGVSLALDDFGTEYSSFDYVRSYRVTHLKVARQFIENAAHDPKQAATVRAIIGAAREMGIKVIAEGVESEEQRSLLLGIGQTTTAQGFYFSEPVSAAAAGRLLRRGFIGPVDPEAARPAAAAAS
jgi:diguanylate cyclase (GGDEF)-like protein